MLTNHKKHYVKINRNEIFLFIILFLASLLTGLYQYSEWKDSPAGITNDSLAIFSGDEPHYLKITSLIVRHQSIHVEDFFYDSNPDPNLGFPPEFQPWENCRMHHSLTAADGHCYTIHGLGLSLLLVPGYAIGGFMGAMITMNIIFSIMGIIIFKFSTNFVTNKIGFITTLIFCFSTILFSFSGEIYTDLVVGVFILSCMYIIFQKDKNPSNVLIVGALLGFLPFLKSAFIFFPIILLPIFAIILIRSKKTKYLIILFGIFSIFLLIFVWYQVITEPIEKAIGFGGYAGLPYLEQRLQIEDNFELITKGITNYLFGHSYGLFVFSPIALLSIFGIKFLWEKNRSLTISLILVFGLFLLLMAWAISYAAAWTTPSRYILPVLPLLSIPFAVLFQRFSKNIIFHITLLFSIYSGVSFNILFSRIIHSHSVPSLRADIADQVYFNASQILPYVDANGSVIKTSVSFFWDVAMYFWIFISIIVGIYGLFFLVPLIKKTPKYSLDKQKIVLISILTGVLISVFLSSGSILVEQFTIEHEIKKLYNEILQRDPDPDGLKHWQNQISNEGKSFNSIREQLKNSQEGITTSQITQMYREILYREPDYVGMTHWKNQIFNEGKSIDWVENMLKNSEEAKSLN